MNVNADAALQRRFVARQFAGRTECHARFYILYYFSISLHNILPEVKT